MEKMFMICLMLGFSLSAIADPSENEVDQSLTDLNQVLTDARKVPHIENGAPAGFVTVPNTLTGKLKNLELRDHDVATAPDDSTEFELQQ